MVVGNVLVRGWEGKGWEGWEGTGRTSAPSITSSRVFGSELSCFVVGVRLPRFVLSTTLSPCLPVVIPILYTATVMPFEIFFVEDTSVPGWYAADITITVLFFFDMIMNLNVAYFDEAGWPVTSRCVVGHDAFRKCTFNLFRITC